MKIKFEKYCLKKIYDSREEVLYSVMNSVNFQNLMGVNNVQRYITSDGRIFEQRLNFNDFSAFFASIPMYGISAKILSPLYIFSFLTSSIKNRFNDMKNKRYLLIPKIGTYLAYLLVIIQTILIPNAVDFSITRFAVELFLTPIIILLLRRLFKYSFKRYMREREEEKNREIMRFNSFIFNESFRYYGLRDRRIRI